MTRADRKRPLPHRSLFQASALLRFGFAALLTVLLWGAILWATR